MPMTGVCPECGGKMDSASVLCRSCRYPLGQSLDKPFPDNPRDRNRYGCVCSFENADGQVIVLHRSGAPTQQLREMCADVLALDETFKLVSYSTPATIYQDLKGARRGGNQSQDAEHGSFRSAMPEAQVLGQLGLSDMLHPRLRA